MSRTDRQGPRRADVARGLSERAGLFIRACVTAALGLRRLLSASSSSAGGPFRACAITPDTEVFADFARRAWAINPPHGD